MISKSAGGLCPASPTSPLHCKYEYVDSAELKIHNCARLELDFRSHRVLPKLLVACCMFLDFFLLEITPCLQQQYLFNSHPQQKLNIFVLNKIPLQSYKI